MTTTISVGTFKERTGQHLGYSDWYQIPQKTIDAFADLTDDHGWPHVDVERSKESPIGGTIAHGFFTLSLFMHFWNQLVTVERKSVLLFYGTNKVRFTAPVPADGRIRLGLEIASVKSFDDGELVTYNATYELEGREKPACFAEVLFRYWREGMFPAHVAV
jgi:acyl dehydratase